MSPPRLVLAGSRAVAALACLSALIGCGSARRGEPVAPPLVLTAEEARGERIFMRECHVCHPGGEGGLGPAINNKPLPGFLIRFQVRRGLGAMPAFPDEKIPPGELDAIVDYLKALRRSPGPEG